MNLHSSFSSNRKLALALAFLMTCLCFTAHAQSGSSAPKKFTGEEYAQVVSMVASVKKQCIDGVDKDVKEIQGNQPAVAKWVKSLINSQDYCNCMAQSLLDQVTPAMLHSTNAEQEGKELGARIGAHCLLQKFKTNFSQGCPELAKANLTEQQIQMLQEKKPGVFEHFCACVQTDINTMTDESVSKSILLNMAIGNTGRDNFLKPSIDRCVQQEITDKLKQ